MRGIKDMGHTSLNKEQGFEAEECPILNKRGHISLNKEHGFEIGKCRTLNGWEYTLPDKRKGSKVDKSPLLVGRRQAGQKGAVTAEAAVVVPIFLCIIISVLFFIKIVYTHEIIQHAITETANEMASVSYIYHIMGFRDLHDTIREGLSDRSRMFDQHMSDLFESYEIINDMGGFADGNGETDSSPLEILKTAAFKIAEGEFDDIKAEICIPLVKLYMNKYLSSGNTGDADKKLKSLNIAGGYEGLDFSRSKFFEDEENNIEIVVEYKIDLPVPFKILPGITLQQRAVAKAWMDGDGNQKSGEGNNGSEDDSTDEDIWSLGNFARGRRIRVIFGANLPESFPVIAKFQSGKATMIKSMDLTAKTYKDAGAVEEKVNEYIDKLREFKGQEQPWGSKGIVIREKDIISKELLLVIPKNPVEPEIRAALESCKARASALGIDLKIEEYGYKKLGQ